ncbi:MAG: M23 family metallopeptidase, partial [Muribaculaceae bacterium]|nr:M23 family metallopeptidase [Muribaculaceae bacterium]
TTPGAQVRCVFDGEVSAVFRPDGYNNVVVIRHGDYMTVYANLGSITVSTGQKIKAGQNIGTVYTDSNDGNRSILHFEIRHRREKENPELWLKR